MKKRWKKRSKSVRVSNTFLSDPTHTANLRKQFTDELRRHFDRLRTFAQNYSPEQPTSNYWSGEAKEAAFLARRASAKARLATAQTPGRGQSDTVNGTQQPTNAALAHEQAGKALGQSNISAFNVAARHHEVAAQAHMEAARGDRQNATYHSTAAQLHQQAADANKRASDTYGKMSKESGGYLEPMPYVQRKVAAANVLNGGEGSGNFGHSGRPGEIGGSGAGDSSNSAQQETWKAISSVDDSIKDGKQVDVSISIEGALSKWNEHWDKTVSDLQSSGATTEEIHEINHLHEESKNALTKGAKDYAEQAEKVSDLHTTKKELEDNEPTEPKEPDYPDEPKPEDFAKDEDHEKAQDRVQAETEKLSARYEKDFDRWNTAHDRWEAKFDRTQEKLDKEKDKLEERFSTLSDALEEHHESISEAVSKVEIAISQRNHDREAAANVFNFKGITALPPKDQGHQPTLAVDFDGTLVDIPEGGTWHKDLDNIPPIKGVVEAVRRAHEDGWRIIIWTARDDYPQIKKWLAKNDVPYDYLNENPDQPTDSPKIAADVYVDDRAITPEEFARNERAVRQDLPSDVGYPQMAKACRKAMPELKELLSRLNFRTVHIDQFDPDKDLTQPGGVVVIAPIKSRERSLEKVKTDYKGDWSRLLDMLRASVAVGSLSELKQAVQTVGGDVVREKNRFKSPFPNGYRDYLVNYKLPCGIICEVQYHVKPILAAREKEKLPYGVVRAVKAAMKSEGRTSMTPSESAVVQKATQASKQLMTDAWQQVTDKRSTGIAANSWVTLESGQHVFIEDDGTVSPSGPKGGAKEEANEHEVSAGKSAHHTADVFGLDRPKVNFHRLAGERTFGEHSPSSVDIVNAHEGRPINRQINFPLSRQVTEGEHIAAHEVAHRAFSENPELGHEAMQKLSKVNAKYGSAVSMYGALEGKHENLMELGATYSHSPNDLKAYSPEMYNIAKDWADKLKSSRTTTNEGVENAVFTTPAESNRRTDAGSVKGYLQQADQQEGEFGRDSPPVQQDTRTHSNTFRGGSSTQGMGKSRVVTANYDPDQPRDEGGRWASVGKEIESLHPFPGPMPTHPPGMLNPKMRAEDPKLQEALDKHDQWTKDYHKAFTAHAIRRMLADSPSNPTPLPKEGASQGKQLRYFQEAADDLSEKEADVTHLGPAFAKYHEEVAASHPQGQEALQKTREEARRRYETSLETAVKHLSELPSGPLREKAQRILQRKVHEGTNNQTTQRKESSLLEFTRNVLNDCMNPQLWGKYLGAAFVRGVGRSFDDVHNRQKAQVTSNEQAYQYHGARQQFVSNTVQNQAQALLSNVWQAYRQSCSNVAVALLSQLSSLGGGNVGTNEAVKAISNTYSSLATLARLAVVRSHAEGQLVSLQNQGVSNVRIQAERGCPNHGKVLSINQAHSAIPTHTTCRCAVLPAENKRTLPEQRFNSLEAFSDLLSRNAKSHD